MSIPGSVWKLLLVLCLGVAPSSIQKTRWAIQGLDRDGCLQVYCLNQNTPYPNQFSYFKYLSVHKCEARVIVQWIQWILVALLTQVVSPGWSSKPTRRFLNGSHELTLNTKCDANLKKNERIQLKEAFRVNLHEQNFC